MKIKKTVTICLLIMMLISMLPMGGAWADGDDGAADPPAAQGSPSNSSPIAPEPSAEKEPPEPAKASADDSGKTDKTEKAADTPAAQDAPAPSAKDSAPEPTAAPSAPEPSAAQNGPEPTSTPGGDIVISDQITVNEDAADTPADDKKEDQQEQGEVPGGGSDVDYGVTDLFTAVMKWPEDEPMEGIDQLRFKVMGKKQNGSRVELAAVTLHAQNKWKDEISLPAYYAVQTEAGGEYLEYKDFEFELIEEQKDLIQFKTVRDGRMYRLVVQPPEGETQIMEPEITNPQEPETAEPGTIQPIIRLAAHYEGDELIKGTLVTITATVEGLPEDASYSMRWQNDISGEFADVPDETGASISFEADEQTANCAWRAILVVEVPEGAALELEDNETPEPEAQIEEA